MSKLFVVTAILLTATMAGCKESYGHYAIPFTRQARLNQECAKRGASLLKKMTNLKNESEPPIVSAFYSNVLNTCVQVESNILSNKFYIVDVTQGFIRSNRDGDEFGSDLFSCDKAGANAIIIKNVKSFNGDVIDKYYGLWLDNGEGGPPATIASPTHPYTSADCDRLMRKALKQF